MASGDMLPSCGESKVKFYLFKVSRKSLFQHPEELGERKNNSSEAKVYFST